MTYYQELQQLAEGMTFPLAARNGVGENVIVERGHDGQQGFFKQTTAQHNGWIQTYFFYEDGSFDETYSR